MFLIEDVVDDAKGPLLVRALRDCHVVACASRLHLSLPLSDRVPAIIAATDVVFLLHLERRTCWQYS